jgi:hypothetical protein
MYQIPVLRIYLVDLSWTLLLLSGRNAIWRRYLKPGQSSFKQLAEDDQKAGGQVDGLVNGVIDGSADDADGQEGAPKSAKDGENHSRLNGYLQRACHSTARDICGIHGITTEKSRSLGTGLN